MHRRILTAGFFALAVLALTATSSAQGNPVLTANPPGPSHAPGEAVEFKVQGLPNTLTVLGIDTDPGPLVLPFGVLHLGLSSAFTTASQVSDDRGCALWVCAHDCHDPAFGHLFYLQAVQLPLGGPPRLSNGISSIWEDLTGACDPEDLCLGGGVKPETITMRYTGDDCGATSHSQDPNKVSCSGSPAFAPMVHVIAHDPPNKHIWFEGDVALGASFVIDAGAATESRLKGETRIDLYDPMSGAWLQSVGFHTSCSEPLFVGDRFGGVELLGMTLEVR